MKAKTCSKCSTPLTEDNTAKGGGRLSCKPCRAAYMREYNSRPHANKKMKDRNKAYKTKNGGRNYKSAQLKEAFGITLEDYEAMLGQQGGVCAICKQPERTAKKGVVQALAVDHDHETGVVRGLLCAHCNRALGLFRDSVLSMEAAIAYLQTPR